MLKIMENKYFSQNKLIKSAGENLFDICYLIILNNLEVVFCEFRRKKGENYFFCEMEYF